MNSLCASEGSGREHGARRDKRARRGCVLHALVGVIPIPLASALRSMSLMRVAVHTLALFPVCFMSGFANEEVRSQLGARTGGAVHHLA